jgi:hypothetical protein
MRRNDDMIHSLFAAAAERGQRIRSGCDLNAGCWQTLETDENGAWSFQVIHVQGCESLPVQRTGGGSQ